MIDQNAAAGERLADEICQSGGEILFYHGDVGKKADLEGFVSCIIKQYGSVDYLINNAMLSYGGILSDCSYEDFTRTLQVGVTAPYYLSKLLLPHFRANAAIVNLSSTRAFQSQADTESYTAAKGGITALTHGLAVSLAGRVRVNSVAPGWIDTGSTYDEYYIPEHTPSDQNQHPVKRIGEPMDIVRTIMFLCDEANGFINGQNITVDGGMSIRMIYSGDEGWSYTDG